MMKTSTKQALKGIATKARDLAQEMNEFSARKRPSPRAAAVWDVAAFINQVNPTRERPVKLQVNTRGAWRDVIGFDASDQIACAEAMSAAESLGRIGRATLRVVIDDGSQTALTRWTAEGGWRDSRSGRSLHG